MDDKLKVEILFKEYDTLREEILQRSRQRFAFMGLLGAAGAYVLYNPQKGYIYLIVLLFVVMLGTWWQLGNVLGNCSRRVAHIEKRINELAGEDLLEWENQRLGSKAFFWMQW